MRRIILATLLAACAASPGAAEPLGLADEIYEAGLEPASGFEVQHARWGGGEEVTDLELAHRLTPFAQAALVAEIRGASGSRRLDAISAQAMVRLGTIGGIEAGLFGEYGLRLRGADEAEARLLLQKRLGGVDARLNLIAEHEMGSGGQLELGYALAADLPLFHQLRVGGAAFGAFGGEGAHVAGPMVRSELALPVGELEVEAGYLFPVDRGDRQLRLLIGLGFEF